MINWLKGKALGLVDAIDRANDPFQEFTRSAQPKYPETLAAKAEKFGRDLLGNFLLFDNRIVNYRIPLPAGSPPDLGDQALWHGIATAMFAFQYSLRPKPASDGDFKFMLQIWQGLKEHQPGGRLIRGIDLNTGRTQDDASNDSATGHLAGLYFFSKYGPASIRSWSGQLIRDWADNIIAHDYALVNADGKPTTYGALIQGWNTDPLRLTLMLAILAAASTFTLGPKYCKLYRGLFTRYRSLVQFAKVRLWWLNNHNDTHRAAIHLAIMQDVFPSGEAHDGLYRIWEMERKSGNAWILFLCSRFLDVEQLFGDGDIENAKKTLSEFTLEDQEQNDEKINSTDASIQKTVWNGEWCGVQPPPRWKCSAQDFIWQRSLYALDKRNPADSRYSGLGFLAAYWLGRQLGLIKEDE